MDALVKGTVEGTGAAINVILGFQPSMIEIFNIDDAGDLSPQARYVVGMEGGSSDTLGGIKLVESTVSPLTVAAGLSLYAGDDPVTWDETNSRWNDDAGSDVTGQYVDKDGGEYGNSVVPDPSDGERIKTGQGFVIGTDGDLNASAETIVFIAHR